MCRMLRPKMRHLYHTLSSQLSGSTVEVDRKIMSQRLWMNTWKYYHLDTTEKLRTQVIAAMRKMIFSKIVVLGRLITL